MLLPDAAAAMKVVSLDMCADQYVLGLLPREKLLGVSARARHADSWYRGRAVDVPQRRPSLETLLALKPDAVVRSWGGDRKLLAGLEARGIKIIQINDVQTFSQAESELVRVGALLGVPQAAEAERLRMRAVLATVGAPAQGRTVLYYTPSAWSAGADTWVGHMLGTLGFTMAAQGSGYYYLSPEVFLRQEADVYALGFYDDAYAMRRVPGRHPLVRRKLEAAARIGLPRDALACPAWYGAYALPQIARELP